MKRNYILTKGAENDLRDIIKYSLENWGEAKSRKYISELEAKTIELANGTGAFRELNEIILGLKVKKVGRVFIFCVYHQGRQPIILAFFHEKMDILTRLKERLEIK